MQTTYSLKHFSLSLEKLATDIPPIREESAKECAIAFLKKVQNGHVGFYQFANTITEKEISAIEQVAKDLRSRFKGAVLCGIGGSYLGAAALLKALQSPEQEASFPLHWLVNVDKTAIEKTRFFLEKNNAATILISKSGNTTETLSGFYAISKQIDPSGIIAITDPKEGELRRLAMEHKWPSFPVPPNIGGRFSVFTAVGLLPLALGGVNIRELLEGVRSMHQELEAIPASKNPALIYAYLKFHQDTVLKRNIQVLMPYESGLSLVGDWYVQLWAESIGKKVLAKPNQSVGATPLPALGTSDQHSMLQLFKEGPNDKIIGLIDVYGETHTPVPKSAFASTVFSFLTEHTFEEINHHALKATEKSLNNSSVPTYTFTFPSLNPKTLGAFLFFQEVACAYAGELYGVDAFNQPGVEEAKKLLRAAL